MSIVTADRAHWRRYIMSLFGGGDSGDGGGTGFADRTDSSWTFTDGTRTFQITPVSDFYTIFTNGVSYHIDSAKSVVIPDTEGLHFIYFDHKTLVSTTTFSPDILTKYALVAAIYWDATNNVSVIQGEERHGVQMDSATHRYNHLTFGARYQSGLALENMDVDGSGNDASAAQFGVSDGFIWDEDIQHTIEDDSPQNLSVPASIPLFYRSGANGDWRKIAATAYPVTTTGGGLAAWNENTGATWQLTESSANDFVLMHYFATNDINNPVIGVVGQSTYLTVAAARAGAITELQTLNFGDLAELTPEFVALATVIFETRTSYGNAVQSRVRSTDTGADYIDWRPLRSGIGASTLF